MIAIQFLQFDVSPNARNINRNLNGNGTYQHCTRNIQLTIDELIAYHLQLICLHKGLPIFGKTIDTMDRISRLLISGKIGNFFVRLLSYPKYSLRWVWTIYFWIYREGKEHPRKFGKRNYCYFSGYIE
jgi:hypothetical protein